MQPYLILFLGAPGAGKGTQSSLLAEKLQFPRIETSKLLEERFKKAQPGEQIEIDGTKYSLEEQKERWRTGLLVEVPVVVRVVGEHLQKLYREGESVVLDGFPRTNEQMKRLLPTVLEAFGKKRILVLYIDIEEETAVFRNSHRRICELMRHSILYLPETKGLSLCPFDGSKLATRELDEPEVIKKRLRVFHEETLPLLDYFKDQGIAVYTIGGEGPVADVFESITEAITQAMQT
ncbi:MAG: nucleoside monophosphate kinase [Patescibacteria group bacterium]